MTVTFAAGVLNADEQRSAVEAPRDAGDFALFRPDHEPLDLARDRVADQHLIVTVPGKISLVGVFAVGLDPQHAGQIEGKAVRCIEHIMGCHVCGAGAGVSVNDRVAVNENRSHVKFNAPWSPFSGRQRTICP